MAALIVLRGNSGSGKSTVATILRPLVDGAWIEQDHFRRVILGEAGAYSPLSVDLIEQAAAVCLAGGRTVILDGIFNAAKYSASLGRLRDGHPGPSLFYAFDLSFEETLRRHGQRPGKSSDFGEEEMRGWFNGWDPLEGILEQRITAAESAEGIAQRILADLRGGPDHQGNDDDG
ncbi:AAA family ATPase [Pseudarthrobacter sp. P1]|uniref:AAA family ATPase n=1 Tax=Pseudarthrobacter sp. P1 TaxID=3418418 RepID=UPI003CED6916